MVIKGPLVAAAFATGVLSVIAGAGEARAGQVEVINRVAVACSLEAPDLSVPLDPKSSKSVLIDDEIGPQIKVVCPNSGLDKDETPCKLLIGGPGGSGKVADKSYDFKYVTKIHVFPNMGQWLVCSSI